MTRRTITSINSSLHLEKNGKIARLYSVGNGNHDNYDTGELRERILACALCESLVPGI